jgi:dihydroorotate dehydrogenase
MYKLFIRPILFQFKAETAHKITFKLFGFIISIPGFELLLRSFFKVTDRKLERELFGIKFSNPIGLAAGFDKDAVLIDGFSTLGFGFIEIGTTTPLPQAGNPKPRLFRLVKDNAIINRMGFNNKGLDMAIKNLKARKSKVVIGGNIGKNKNTPNEEAELDYLKCFNALHPYVDYFVVNVSSPNTPNLRDLQEKEPLKKLISTLQVENAKLAQPKPILLKIAPDLTESQLDDVVDIAFETNLAGVIATNTTISRSGLDTDSATIETIGAGGLSGRPLNSRSVEVIRYIHQRSNAKIPIIGVGGINSPEAAQEMLNAGASLVQIYTGLIYEGPSLVKRINQHLARL